MAKLTILRGISGSGKSTWARQQSAVIVSRDTIRHEILAIPAEDYYKVEKEVLFDREQTVTRLQDAMIAASLRAGKDVIVDNTNVEFKFVNQIAKIGYREGADVQVKFFDVSLPVAIAADKRRGETGGRYVGEKIIRDQHSRIQGNKNHTLNPPYTPQPYSGTPGKEPAFLFDLDGTTYHMNGKRGAYDHNVDVDDPDHVIQEMVRIFSHFYVPVAMSGRVEATREKTEFSLNRDGVPYDHLFMRKDGDMRADNIVKGELFDIHVRDNYDVKFVLDDRDQVVDMWRAMGLKCVQVEPGAF